MTQTIPALHHVTAIAGSAQARVDFFTRRRGRRLVKRRVNFDAPDTWQLYHGEPPTRQGILLTFFPFADAAPGRAGPGRADAYALPMNAFGALTTDLAGRGLIPAGGGERFSRRVAVLSDPDGAPVDLVETEGAANVRVFHSVTLWVRAPEPTRRLLTDVMGFVARVDDSARVLAAPGAQVTGKKPSGAGHCITHQDGAALPAIPDAG